MNEEWKNIEPFIGYQVSSHGRVRSFLRQAGESSIITDSPRDIKHQLGTTGRPQVSLIAYKKSRACYTFAIHRLVAAAFIPNPDRLPQVNHRNGVKSDNRADNLEWCSARSNAIHSRSVLGNGIGEAHGNSVITESDVLDIRSLRAFGAKLKDIAEAFFITESNVSIICLRKAWTHIP